MESHVPNHASKVSSKSPYTSLFSNLAGNYVFSFYDSNEKIIYTLDLSIDQYNFNILANHPNIIIENDSVELTNRGQNVYLDFEILGVSYLQKTSIYVKTFYLMNPEKEIFGVFSGIDLNNNTIHGKVKIDFKK